MAEPRPRLRPPGLRQGRRLRGGQDQRAQAALPPLRGHQRQHGRGPVRRQHQPRGAAPGRLGGRDGGGAGLRRHQRLGILRRRLVQRKSPRRQGGPVGDQHLAPVRVLLALRHLRGAGRRLPVGPGPFHGQRTAQRGGLRGRVLLQRGDPDALRVSTTRAIRPTRSTCYRRRRRRRRRPSPSRPGSASGRAPDCCP